MWLFGAKKSKGQAFKQSSHTHLNKNGLALFGAHTTAEKVNIGNSNFKTITVSSLSELKVEKVIEFIRNNLN